VTGPCHPRVAVVVLLVRWRPLARAGSWIGQRTLPVYVLHIPLLLVLLATLGRDPQPRLGGLLSNTAVALACPLVLTALLIGVTLLLHRVLLGLPAGALFTMPASWIRAVHRAHARLTGHRTAPAPAPLLD
jgi:fucose 4-O-acetylase-like acetyltransferase